MKHARLAAFVMLALAGCASAPPAPPVVAIEPARAAPAPPSVAVDAQPVSVAGTVWAGPDSEGTPYEYHFLPGGELHYQSPTGFWKNGTWKQDGATVYMETNNRYSERWGTITGLRMAGKAKNVTGAEWTFSAEMRRGRSPGEPNPPP